MSGAAAAVAKMPPAAPYPGQTAPQGMVNMQQAQMQQAMAMQRTMMAGGYGAGSMWPGYPQACGYGGGMQAAQGGVAPGGMGAAAGGGGFPAAYAAWAAAYGGCGGYDNSKSRNGTGGAKGSSTGSEKGKGCFGKGKGKGKGWKGVGVGSMDTPGSADWESDPRRQIELAQKRAKQRDRSSIQQAQRSAQQRFEKDYLDRVQGAWVDAADPETTYMVEGGLCSVSGGSRVFRNRIGLYGGDLCWDARRFWHYLNVNALPPAGELVERVEWNPGEGSPPTKQIVWLRAPDQPERQEASTLPGEPEDDKKDGQEGDAAEPEVAASTAQAVAEAAVA